MTMQEVQASAFRRLVLLDRDGVLNDLVVDAEFGRIDSPLNENEVRVYPWIPKALKLLTEAGYGILIVTNQPAAKKGKTTIQNLEALHKKILDLSQSEGGRILNSYICYHVAEDNCSCRKPKTGLLEKAFNDYPWAEKTSSWMVGDGITDVQAGVSFGLKTAFLGPNKCDTCKIFFDAKLTPTFWGDNLFDFAKYLVS